MLRYSEQPLSATLIEVPLKNGKLVKVSNNDRREGWRAERVLIHGATHWMAPP